MEKSCICILKSAKKNAVNCNYIANLIAKYRENCTNNTILDNAEKNFALRQIPVKNLGSFTELNSAVSKCTASGGEKLYVVKESFSNLDTIYSSGVKICYL